MKVLCPPLVITVPIRVGQLFRLGGRLYKVRSWDERRIVTYDSEGGVFSYEIHRLSPDILGGVIQFVRG